MSASRVVVRLGTQRAVLRARGHDRSKSRAIGFDDADVTPRAAFVDADAAAPFANVHDDLGLDANWIFARYIS